MGGVIFNTENYENDFWLVWDDPWLLDDGREVPKLNEVVGGSIPGC